jgi:hypothetical protein
MSEIPAEALGERDAARIVGLSPATLSTLRCRGGGPPFLRLGRAIRYRVSDLRAWRDARLVTSTADTSTAEQPESKPRRCRRTKAG